MQRVAKRVEDQIEDQVRRRLTEMAASAGVNRSRLSQEVLFLLPPEFVRLYRDLFDRALGDPVRRAGDGGKDEGQLKADRKSRDPMRARSRAGASSTGKRFVAGAWPIRSEQALEEKRRLDKILVRAAEKAMGAAQDRNLVHINLPRCTDCGRIQAGEWLRCPFHH